MCHSEKFSETLNEIIYHFVGFVMWKKKEKPCSKRSKNCCNSQCVLEILMSYTYYNSTQLRQNQKMKDALIVYFKSFASWHKDIQLVQGISQI